MPRSKAPTVTLEELKGRFGEWRQNRRGRATIPEELWAAAVEVARREGVSRIATELHLGWSDLKQRIAAAGSVSRRAARTQFVELIAPVAEPVSECTIELEGSSGRVSALLRRMLTLRIMPRRNENGGREESRVRNQRRNVDRSAMRSGSLTSGAAASNV